MKIAVTGANSSVGLNLLNSLVGQDDITIIAGVRSDKAAATLPESNQIEARIISYDDPEGLKATFAGADCVVHLAGILIESKHSNYASANVAATASVVAAAQKAGVKHILFISVVGASAGSPNAYFRSKGVAEQIVAESGLGASILRTPILLGPGSAGATSLLGAAASAQTKVLGGGNYTMRPLDIDDLNRALIHLCSQQVDTATTYELVGPEPISYRDLISRTAELLGNKVEIGSIPILVAKIGAGITSTLKGGGMTPTVIDVITKDEVIAANADKALGITLTPLSKTLERILPNN